MWRHNDKALLALQSDANYKTMIRRRSFDAACVSIQGGVVAIGFESVSRGSLLLVVSSRQQHEKGILW